MAKQRNKRKPGPKPQQSVSVASPGPVLEAIDEAADHLNPRQLAFVRAIVRGASGAQAAIEAGYSEEGAAQQASRLLTYANVSEAIARIRREVARATEMDATWVVNRLRDISDRALTAVPVLDSQGEPTGLFKFDGAAANKATELIGKAQGMFVTKLQLEVRQTHEEALAELE
jgi:phage terminase small subunit